MKLLAVLTCAPIIPSSAVWAQLNATSRGMNWPHLAANCVLSGEAQMITSDEAAE